MYRKLSDKRRKIEEEEETGDSSESEPEQEQKQETKKRILPIDARATNKWNERITKLMNIKVYDEMLFDIEKDRKDDNNPLYLNIITDDMWRGYIDVGGLSVNRELKTLVAEVKKMYDKASKSLDYFVDTYVSTLLNSMEMNFYPLSVGLKHELEVEIGINQERITSIPDFVVRSFESNMIVIVEDKTLKNATFVNQWKENQVLGELFTAAHNIIFDSEYELYGIRIIGTLFTFYKAVVTEEYLRESLIGLPKKNYMKVYRYPPPGNSRFGINALDFCKLEDRKVIVRYLEKIRNIILDK